MKRRAGDRWGIVCIDGDTNEVKRVQIAGWEVSNFPYKKQAQKYADSSNQRCKANKWNRRYEIRYVGNANDNPWTMWA